MIVFANNSRVSGARFINYYKKSIGKNIFSHLRVLMILKVKRTDIF